MRTDRTSRSIVVGRVAGLYGVKGWIKVYSFTQPRQNILKYSPWFLCGAGSRRAAAVAESRVHGKALIARLEGVTDRDAAAELVGTDILVDRDQLGDTEEGEFYWTDLVGLRVVTEDGREIGVVDHLLETGANDVLVVAGDRRRLVPFVMDQVIRQVDLENGTIIVAWDPDY